MNAKEHLKKYTAAAPATRPGAAFQQWAAFLAPLPFRSCTLTMSRLPAPRTCPAFWQPQLPAQRDSSSGIDGPLQGSPGESLLQAQAGGAPETVSALTKTRPQPLLKPRLIYGSCGGAKIYRVYTQINPPRETGGRSRPSYLRQLLTGNGEL